MARPLAHTYLDALWTVAAGKLTDQAQVTRLSNQVENDPQLSDVERAGLLGMLKTLGCVEPTKEGEQ
jgi:hypothetical protein